MTTAAEDALADLFEGRGEAGREGFRTHSVAIVWRHWSSGQTGVGDYIDKVTSIVEGFGQPPRVRWLNEEELAVGSLPRGTVEIGPITPPHSGGGTSVALLKGDRLEPGDELLFRITGPMHPNGALYAKTQLKAERATRYVVQAKPREEQTGP